MKVYNVEIFGIDRALRAMRNPKNSWDVSGTFKSIVTDKTIVDLADIILSQALVKGGGEHCKHLRFITVYMEIDAPRYFWQEFDTYKHVEKISCSTMHKLFERELSFNDFEISNKHITAGITYLLEDLKILREDYLRETDENIKKDLLIQAKSLLPESFIQKRSIVTNYQQLLNIYKQRKHHRLPVWRILCEEIEEMPYFRDLVGIK